MTRMNAFVNMKMPGLGFTVEMMVYSYLNANAYPGDSIVISLCYASSKLWHVSIMVNRSLGCMFGICNIKINKCI